MKKSRAVYASNLQAFYRNEIEKCKTTHEEDKRDLWSKQLEVTRHFTKDFVAEVHTVRRGIVGKLTIFIKRIFRKGTYYIFKQFSEKIYDFQSKNMELEGQIIQFLMDMEGQMSSMLNEQQHLKESQATFIADVQKCVDSKLHSQAQVTESLCKRMDDQFGQIANVQKQTEGKLQAQAQVAELLGNRLNEYADQLRLQQAALLLRRAGNFELTFTGRNTGIPSYSQCGEDGILNYLLFTIFRTNPESIHYLDIGCNDYKDDNNTYFFYLCGASGVVIDANPCCIERMKRNRCRDIALNIGIGPEDAEATTFHIMENYGLSTFSAQSVEDMIEKNKENKVANEIEVPIVGINTILNQYFKDGAPEIMSIDAEGMDAEILKAMDFEVYRPKLVVVETIDYAPWVIVGKKREDILKIMENHGYEEFAFTGINSIFIDPAMVR